MVFKYEYNHPRVEEAVTGFTFDFETGSVIIGDNQTVIIGDEDINGED